MLHIQKYLLDGNKVDSLTTDFGISVKRHPAYPNLVMLKYDQIDSSKHFGLEMVRECRGLILDENDGWKAICYTMPKFFNFGEHLAHELDWSKTIVYEKLDGSLCQLYAYDGKWQFATSGSPDGGGDVGDFGFKFSELFWKTFTHDLPPVDCGVCFWFELTSIYNKIVVMHPTPGVTLLGARNLNTMQELTLEEAAKFFPTCPVVRSFPLNTIEGVFASFETFSGASQEGYVCYDGVGRAKLKHPQYVAMHHLKDRLSSQRALVEVVRNGEVDEVIAALPEYTEILTEAKKRMDALVLELEAVYDTIKEIPVQKDFALEAIKTRCSSVLFTVRAKKAPSIRVALKDMNVDSVMSLLGYKANKEYKLKE